VNVDLKLVKIINDVNQWTVASES